MKISFRKNKNEMICILSGKDSPDEKQISVLKQSSSKCFLPVSFSGNFLSDKISYSLEGYCSVRHYLPMMHLKKYQFIQLINNILRSTEEAYSAGFSTDRIHMDPAFVMMCPLDCSVKFIYIPCSSFSCSYNICTLLQYIAQNTVFKNRQDSSFSEKVMEISELDEKTCFSEMKKYIRKILSEAAGNGTETESIRRCPQCGSLIVFTRNCTSCGSTFGGQT